MNKVILSDALRNDATVEGMVNLGHLECWYAVSLGTIYGSTQWTWITMDRCSAHTKASIVTGLSNRICGWLPS